jgi:hypothetical protein
MALTKVSYSMITGAVANVMDYGAKGDGVTDDAAAIQAAYNYIASIGGGTVYIPSTKEGYKINTAINCTNGFYAVDFVGAGSSSIPNARPNNDALGTTIWLNTGTVGFDLTGCATIGFRSLTLDTFHTTKVTNPARVGILSGRTAAQPNSFNHKFTDLTVFMKTTGSATSPSIALYASNVELMTCLNCWFHGDIATVLTNIGLYNVASPFVSIVNTAVSATDNVFLSCKFISISGVGPALRIEQTVNNTIIGSYFGNDVDTSTYPAVLLTGAVQKLLIKGFQSEERTEFLEITGNAIECEFYGTHAGENAISPICNFQGAGSIFGCKFDIYNSAVATPYSAYTGTINSLLNSYFNLGTGGNFAVTCTTFTGNSFNKLGGIASYTGIPSVNSDATINNVYFSSLYVRKQDFPFQKTNATNNSQFVFAFVAIPNSEVNAIIEIPYTLNSASGQLIRTGRLRVNAARVGGITSVVTMSEEAAQVALQTTGAETIAASFAVGLTSGAVNATQTIELTTTINSSLATAGYIRGIATVQSAYFTNSLVQDHIYLVSA